MLLYPERSYSYDQRQKSRLIYVPALTWRFLNEIVDTIGVKWISFTGCHPWDGGEEPGYREELGVELLLLRVEHVWPIEVVQASD